jgi:tripartite-type tricarboxylate transporter receptor subunit TctC
MSGELFKSMAKVEMAHISYKGAGPALIDLLGGHLDLMFPAILSSAPYHKSGRLRGLGVTSARRHPSLPDLPAVAEAGLPGYQTGSWYGILVPAKTAREIIVTLHKQTVTALAAPAFSKRLVDLGYISIGDTPEEFGAHIKSEIASLARVLRDLNVTAN